MYGSKQQSNVVLFPLCDERGALTRALCNKADEPMTKTDTLVFVWQLELPKHIPVGVAANALLAVALAVPRESWHSQQLAIVRELMKLADQNASVPTPQQSAPMSRKLVSTGKKRPEKPVSALEQLVRSSSFRKGRNLSAGRRTEPEAATNTDAAANTARPTVSRNSNASKRRSTDRSDVLTELERKQQKDWWHLVGSGSRKASPPNRDRRSRRTNRDD